MAPTVARDGPFRLYLFSREEVRIHVHVAHPDGEAKFCLTPTVSVASSTGLSGHQLREAEVAVVNHIEMHGTRTLAIEVTNISGHAIWVLLGEEELMLPFETFPWFRHATVSQLSNVEWPTPNHIYWPQLDIDLSVESIRDPSAFPLLAKSAAF